MRAARDGGKFAESVGKEGVRVLHVGRVRKGDVVQQVVALFLLG